MEKSDNAFVNAKAAAIRVVKAYKATAREESHEVSNFLKQLDERILLGELSSEFNRRWKERRFPMPIRLVWRGVNPKGYAALWLARMGVDSLGLLFKTGRRFEWVTGPSDEILAHIPDEHFEAAALAALD